MSLYNIFITNITLFLKKKHKENPMNKTQTLVINDPFRAAYLLRFGKYKKTQFKDGQRCYVIEGEMLSEEDYRYRTGYAMVNPLSLRISGRTKAMSGKQAP